MFQGIARDGWIEQGATIRPRFLASRGNTMELDLHAWRPAGMAPAQMRVTLCGAPVAEFTVDRDMKQLLYLTGKCEPREVQFEVLNPFQASDKDLRQLGAQLRGVTISSRFGIPIVKPEITLQVFAAILLLALIFWMALSGTSMSFVSQCRRVAETATTAAAAPQRGRHLTTTNRRRHTPTTSRRTKTT